MISNKASFIFITSVITGFLIFGLSPSDNYLFSNRTSEYNTTILAQPTSTDNIQFTDSTFQSGLFFTHHQGDQKLTGINESLGSGACVLDYDNDGLQDLFIVNGSGQNRFYGKLHWWQQQNSHQLFKNIGNNHFVNKTKTTGIDVSSWGMGCIATDFNNDGYSDLLITTLNSNQLFKNNGDGSFSKINNFAKNTKATWSTSACAADFNNDGLIDLYIANFINYDKTQLTYEGQSEFTKAQTEFFNSSLFNPVSNRLYINNGDFSFTDITKSSGLIDISSRSLAVRCTDINNDNLPDIIVANEKGDGSNRVYINQSELSFSDFSEQFQFQNNTGSRSISVGDINNDGIEELLLLTGVQQNNRLYQTHSPSPKKTFYTDIARTWGLTDNISSFQSNWGGGLHDFNQDGLLDIFIVNGFLTPDPDTPRVSKGQPNQLWLNTGKLFKTSNTFSTALNNSFPESSRSSVFADFDNDGDMDIYISNNNHLGQLLINNTLTMNHWLGVQLVDSSNSLNITGARVTVISNLGTQTRTISAGDSFLSDSEDRLLFGLNQDSHIKRLTVTWPNGQQIDFDNITLDQYITIDFSKGIVTNKTALLATSPESSPLPSNNTETTLLFLSLLSQSHDIENALPYLHTALNSPNDLIKEAAITQLAKFNHPSSLALLINTIEDKSDSVAAFALDKLCNFEDESTVRWLIQSLSDSRNIIRRTSTQCFERLYHEEEAMIHRKYLALPSLINLLTDKNTSVQLASIKALAEAEHYRAVEPLISLLDSEKPLIRAEASRALGFIREKEAIPALLSQLHNDTEAAKVYASSVIALKRLAYKNFTSVFNDFFQGLPPFNNINTLKRTNTLLYLYRNTQESIAIHPHTIKEMALRLIKQNMTDKNLLIKLIPVLASSDSSQAKLLIELSQNSNLNVSFKAYMAQLYNAPNNREVIMDRVSQLASLSIKNKILSALKESQIKVTPKSLTPFLNSPDTSKAAILNLASINTRSSTQLLSKKLINSKFQALILKLLKDSHFSQYHIAEPYLSSKDPTLKQSAYDFYLNKLPKNQLLKKMPSIFISALNQETEEIRNLALLALSTRRELWAIKILQRVILNTSEKDDLRLKLLNHFKHPFQKNWVIMFKIANNNLDPIRQQVISRLSHFNNPEVIQFFKTLVSNSSIKDDSRNLAFSMLAKNAPKWTFNLLINQSKALNNIN